MTDPPPHADEGAPRGEATETAWAASIASFSGPIPPPEYFRAYKEVSNDLPDRIMAMAEKEQAHTHQKENRELDLVELEIRSQFRATARGSYLGATLVLIVFCIAALLVYKVNAAAGVVFGVVDLVTLAAVFVNQPNRGAIGKGDAKEAKELPAKKE